jgi:peptide/nickel transport system substrate-binding protein
MKHRSLFWLVLVLLLSVSVSLVAAQDTTFGESPMLAERVSAGDLPPVEERLPSNPRVIEMPWAQVGTYGGDFRDPFVGDAFWSSQMVFWTFWKGLVSWNPDYSDWVPNIAESVDVSEDATSYTFHLRDGIKWSDGEPFTSNDVAFVINDILGNEELNGGTFPAGWLKPGDAAPVVEIIDDLNFSITFDVPYGMFLLNMAGWPGWELVVGPKHYLEQFHIDYNPDGIDELITLSVQARTLLSSAAT